MLISKICISIDVYCRIQEEAHYHRDCQYCRKTISEFVDEILFEPISQKVAVPPKRQRNFIFLLQITLSQNFECGMNDVILSLLFSGFWLIKILFRLLCKFSSVLKTRKIWHIFKYNFQKNIYNFFEIILIELTIFVVVTFSIYL